MAQQPRVKKQKAPRKRPSFSKEALHYAQILFERGTHGDSINEVLKTLVQDGVKQAFRDGILRPEDLLNPPKKKEG